MPSFDQLTFGKSGAENEGLSDPALLIDGFFDAQDGAKRILQGDDFLVLGYKGSGKSAIAQHLSLLANSDSSLFVKTVYLSDVPYEEFARIEIEGVDASARFPAIWTWILQLYLLESLASDPGYEKSATKDFRSLVSRLRKAGFIPSTTVPIQFGKTKLTSFSFGVKGLATASVSDKDAPRNFTLGPVVERIHSIVLSSSSPSDHLLVIDGLDDVLLGDQSQAQALASLVLAVARMNRRFSAAAAPCKVVLLCRTDIFDSLPLPNSNKLRQDSAIVLDWYQDARMPERSDLVRMVNVKATVHIREAEIRDVFREYLPEEYRGRKIIPALLDLTRHTPRDILCLLRYIQEAAPFQRQVSQASIAQAAKNYSINYFLPEIKNELQGFLTQLQVTRGMELLTAFGRGEFFVADVRHNAQNDRRFADFDIESLLERLFECSAIGNVRPIDGGRRFFTFKYRNQSASINMGEKVHVHQGLWRGLGLSWDRTNLDD